jgi:hypothetical protein
MRDGKGNQEWLFGDIILNRHRIGVLGGLKNKENTEAACGKERLHLKKIAR